MKRKFNVTGSCNPKTNYMVKLDDSLRKIKENYVDDGTYFVTNRGRQYGKTTTLKALEGYLEDDYIVLSLDFQEISTAGFANGVTFSNAFIKKLSKALGFAKAEDKEELQKNNCSILERTIRKAVWMNCLSA